MLIVYKVDNSTRLVMPNTQWTTQVLDSLRAMGHQIEATDEDPKHVMESRSDDERHRMNELLDSTGL